MKTEPSYSAVIYIAGNYDALLQACSEFCEANPLFVSIQKTNFVYELGMQSGASVTIINYAKFPSTPVKINETARRLALFLMCRLHQKSCSIVSDEQSFYLERPADL